MIVNDKNAALHLVIIIQDVSANQAVTVAYFVAILLNDSIRY